jgi:hypothetical protein
MTAPLETLRQAVLTWVAAYAKPDGVALVTAGLGTAVQVVFADQPHERPDLPYLTIDVTSPGAANGHDEQIDGLTGGGAPTKTPKGRRTATISIQGYGEDTAEWLEELRLSMTLADAVADTLEAAGYPRFGFFTDGPLTNVGQLLDTENEHRYGLDVFVHYAVAGAARTQIELATIETTVTQSSDAYPDLETTITATV